MKYYYSRELKAKCWKKTCAETNGMKRQISLKKERETYASHMYFLVVISNTIIPKSKISQNNCHNFTVSHRIGSVLMKYTDNKSLTVIPGDRPPTAASCSTSSITSQKIFEHSRIIFSQNYVI